MFVIFDVIDAKNPPKLRFRKFLRIWITKRLRFRIPLTPWIPLQIRGPVNFKRLSKYHCDYCEKYSGWRD